MKTNLNHLFNSGLKKPFTFLNFVFSIPKLIKLYLRLFRDHRTPFHLKLILIAAIIYVLSPIDLIPDLLLPIIGQVDDLIILIMALQYFIKRCPPEIVSEHIQANKSHRSNST